MASEGGKFGHETSFCKDVAGFLPSTGSGLWDFGWIWMDFFHFCLIVFGDQECGRSHKAINFLGDEYA